MNATQSQDTKQGAAATATPNPNQMPNPFENISKRTESFLGDIKKLSTAYEDAQKKRADLLKREKELQKERDDIAASENKLESDLLSLLKSVHGFLNETIAYSSEIYRRSQAEINYRIQAEAAQRALADAAQKVLSDAAERARAEAEYRKKAEEAQKKLIEQAQKAQAEAAQRIQAELTKTGHIILDSKRITPKEEPKPAGGKPSDTSVLNVSKKGKEDEDSAVDLDEIAKDVTKDKKKN